MSVVPTPARHAVRRILGGALLTLVVAATSAVSFDDPKKGPPTESQQAADTVDLICFAAKRPIVIRLRLSVDGRSLSEFQTAVSRRLFDTLDADKNGILEGKEIGALPTPQMIAGAGREPGTPLPASSRIAPLVPEKGKVTPEAFRRFLFPPSGGLLSLVSQARGEPTMNGPIPELVTMREGSALPALLSAIDLDGDRRISVAELSRVDDLFRLFDVNDDEQIAQGELDSLLTLRASLGFSQAGPAQLAVPLEPIPRAPDKTALIRRLIESFGTESNAKDRPVAKGKKTTTARPRKVPADCIAGADKNGDGWLDEAELGDWLVHPQPQCELSIELAASSLQEPTVKLVSVHPSAGQVGLTVETPSGGRVLGRVVLSVGSVPLELRAAEASRRVIRTSRYRALFKRADQNQNGYLEKSEIPVVGLGLDATDFDAMDRDHNGMVFEDEWLAYLRLRDTFTDGRLSLTVASEFLDPIAQFDANHDGRLNRAEFRRLLSAIAGWDHNHDGFVTPDEVPKTLVGTFHIGPFRTTAARNPRSSRMKAAQTSQPVGEGPIWFQKMDRDHDGEVSLREFLGPIAVFRRLDTNGDGRIDGREAQSAAK
jgi:Ca2+-binding EF-hand superfamily protein